MVLKDPGYPADDHPFYPQAKALVFLTMAHIE